ncbi:Endoribonuclease [Pseudolycoriella hygida]|uniref:Endoribonuclease n=1 Tax=Pseudolycoriella hygida TaxID=35572 RepID=A0A9Q0MQN7_9DIPT|nr:Endoribonuclease [Pseudolycoriella hygida]
MKLFLIFWMTFLLKDCNVSEAQGLQQLSYANADIGQKLIRSTVTTEPPPPTTRKTSFFGGIRNYFVRKSTEAPIVTSTEPNVVRAITPLPGSSSSTTTSGRMVPRNPAGNAPPIMSQTSNIVVPRVTPSTSSTTTTTTSRPKPPQEDFPPLGPPRRQNSVSSTTPSTTTLHSVWSTPPRNGNPPNVQFIPQQPSPSNVPQPSTFNIPKIEIASNSELEVLTEELFNKEASSLFEKIAIDYQGRTQSSALTDEAPRPLLTVNETDLESINSIKLIRKLYNNYELDTMTNEYVTPLEKKEENDFVDAIMATSVMRHAMTFLQQKGKVTPDPKTHRDLLKRLWFSLYSRGRGRIGSSAFEHVFLSETKNGSITGLHNWVYFHDEEEAGRADYKGWLKKVELGRKGAIVKYRFSHNNINKPVNAMFIGTSPELEVALYTVCFEVRPDKECPISLGGNKLLIRTHTFRYRGKVLIGSAFPEI